MHEYASETAPADAETKAQHRTKPIHRGFSGAVEKAELEAKRHAVVWLAASQSDGNKAKHR